MSRAAPTESDGVDLGLVPHALRSSTPRAEVRVGDVVTVALARTLDRRGAPPVRRTFPRPGWHYAGVAYASAPVAGVAVAAVVAGGSIAALLAAVPSVLAVAAMWKHGLFHVRVRWDDERLVLEGWPRRIGAQVARADLVDVWVGRDHVIVRTRDGRGLPLVVGRRATRADRERACGLARDLGLPLVDDTGELAQLPAAIVRHGGEAP
jgi:hypothetical protein